MRTKFWALPPAADLLTVNHLKMSGWTDRLIAKYLGEPDKITPSRMRLYRKARVIETTALPEVRQQLEAALERRRIGP